MKKMTLKRQDGFSLIELLIFMVLLGVVLSISSDTFSLILGHSTQQAKTAEAQMERAVGIELLRTDIEHAGFGLPWSFQGGINYDEAASGTLNDSPNNLPRALVSINNTGWNGSDYLVIKAANVGMSNASQRWSYIIDATGTPRVWGANDFIGSDGVIIVRPEGSDNVARQLVMSGGNFSVSYGALGGFSPQIDDVIYGVDDGTPLRMPFNRADYYINRPATIPSTCAPNTGVLYKATVNRANGGLTSYPILDCVADLQVIFDNNGVPTDDITLLTAQEIREQVREVRVYILTHEGQMDLKYTYPNNTVTVGEFGLGSDFDVSGQLNYRWKVITLVVRPKNLR